ncbi:MAG: hypothetical protein K2Q14_04030, partial [Gammaproteobacteria bacterium]|nr:hypothetical protein [Gammaproteobacteria bacterium]
IPIPPRPGGVAGAAIVSLGLVDNSTLLVINPRFSALRCPHTYMYAVLRCSKIEDFCRSTANWQRALVFFNNISAYF